MDIEALRKLGREVKPKLITIGGSLNLFPHPIKEIRAIADEVGAYVLFDAAHLSGMIAGHAWQQPLEEGADLMTMSTYKSLGGPPSGLIVTNNAALAERLDHIAYPGLTANFDVAKTAALAVTLLDWKVYGKDYAAMMAKTARAFAEALRSLKNCRFMPPRKAAQPPISLQSTPLHSAAGKGVETIARCEHPCQRDRPADCRYRG